MSEAAALLRYRQGIRVFRTRATFLPASLPLLAAPYSPIPGPFRRPPHGVKRTEKGHRSSLIS